MEAVTVQILNDSSESVVSCLGSTTVHWSVQYTVVIKMAATAQFTVTSLQAVSVHVSTSHEIVLKCTDTEHQEC